MPTNEKRTLSPNLGDLVEGLKEAGVAFILVGGLATVIQGAPVTTMDVDVVHRQSDENISKLSCNDGVNPFPIDLTQVLFLES